MAKLRHLAILTHQPEKLADFYKKVFELKEMYRTKNGSVHLSDGEVNLAILNATDPKEPGHAAGMYHFGFHVDDAEVVAQRIPPGAGVRNCCPKKKAVRALEICLVQRLRFNPITRKRHKRLQHR